MLKKRYMIIIVIFLLFSILIPSISFSENYKFEHMWPGYQEAWNFQWPCGIEADRQGNIFIVNNIGENIQKYSVKGKFISAWQIESEESFSNPKNIAISHDNFIYITDNNFINKFNSNNELILTWGGQGTEDGSFDGAEGIAIDYTGNVYVADKYNDRIQKFNSNGKFLKSFGSSGSGQGMFNEPADISIDSDNNIYISDSKNNRIQKFDSQGNFLKEWGSSGNGALNSPAGIFNDGEKLFVADENNSKVQVFTLNGEYVDSWGEYGLDDGQFRCISDITGYGDLLFVTDSFNNNIQIFSKTGVFVTLWGKSIDELYEFWDICFDDEENLYAADVISHCILKFDSNGNILKKIGGYGTQEGQLWHPNGIALFNNYIYVTDNNHRIQKFDLNGEFIDQWGGKGSADGKFNTPQDIAIDEAGNIFVADALNHRIQKFDSSGNFIKKWGSYGSETGQFSEPRGLAIFDQNIYIADHNNNRIQKFSSQGEFISSWGSEGSDSGELQFPWDISLDESGNIFVADTYNNRIQKFNSEGVFITSMGTEGSGPGELNLPYAVALNKKGRVFVADTINTRVQIFYDANLPEYKAIIVAGGGFYLGNNLWDATQMCANLAYRSLAYKGFTRHSIYYMSSNTSLDIDGNGIVDVDADSTVENFENAISGWANDVENLILYMVDHGGDGVFRINDSELLDAQDLDTWLDNLQSTYSINVIIVYDACKSGSFLEYLTPPENEERIIISSSLDDENAYFVGHGSISFSAFFWTQIFNGSSLYHAFDYATSAMNMDSGFQTPLLDSNGNGIGNEEEDFNIALKKYIGNGVHIDDEAPEIGSISPEQSLDHLNNSAMIYAENVVDEDEIARVWAVVRPPDYNVSSIENPINGLPEFNLLPVGDDRYEGSFSDFNITGSYLISVYAMDVVGNISLAKITKVTVVEPLSNKALIITGYSSSYTQTNAFINNAEYAYNTLIFQGFEEDDISLMASDSNNITPGIKKIQEVINGAKTGTNDFILYMVGEGNDNYFIINENEKLTSTVLDKSLDDLQDSINGIMTVIYDASCSGNYIASLTPAQNENRILVGSSNSTRALFLANGDISFSSFFWQRILNGYNIKDAYIYTYNAITYACDTQIPVLDDNGDGLGYEAGIDGKLAENYTIGFGIMLASDDPIISSVSAPETLTQTNSAIVKALVTGTKSIKKVWVLVKEPTHSILSHTSLQKDPVVYELQNTGENIYEIEIDEFNIFGIYTLTFYASDVKDNISMPVQCKIYQTIGPDIYEEDDDSTSAGVIVPDNSEPEHHNFHEQNDEDWVKFYALEDVDYTIEVSNPENSCDAVINLFEEDAQTAIKENWNLSGAGEDEFMSWKCPGDGIYYVRITNFLDSDQKETGYYLQISGPTGPLPGFVSGIISDKNSGSVLKDVRLRTDGNASTMSDENGVYVLFDDEGWYTLRAFKDENYDEFKQRVKILPLDETPLSIELERKDRDMDGLPDDLELETGTDPDNEDTDGDTIPDGIEDSNQNGIYEENLDETDPRKMDTDGDGFNDNWEIQYEDFDPNNPNNPTKDTDNDGYSDKIEYDIGTDPNKADISPGEEGYNPETDNRTYRFWGNINYDGCQNGDINIEVYDQSDFVEPPLSTKTVQKGYYEIELAASLVYYMRVYMNINDSGGWEEIEPVTTSEVPIKGIDGSRNIDFQLIENYTWHMSLSQLIDNENILSNIIVFDMKDENCTDIYQSKQISVNNENFLMSGSFIDDNFFSSLQIGNKTYYGKGTEFSLVGFTGRSLINDFNVPYYVAVNADEIESPDLNGFLAITMTYEGYDWSLEDKNGHHMKSIYFNISEKESTNEFSGFDESGNVYIELLVDSYKIYWTLYEVTGEKNNNNESTYFCKGSGIYDNKKIYGTYIGLSRDSEDPNGKDFGQFYAGFTPIPKNQLAIGSPSPIVYSKANFSIPIKVDTGSSILGNYSSSIDFCKQAIEIKKIEGKTSGFTTTPIETINSTGVINISDSLARSSETSEYLAGVVHLADLSFEITGSPGSSCTFLINDSQISDADNFPITVSSVHSSVYMIGEAAVSLGTVEPVRIFYDSTEEIPVTISKAYNQKIASYQLKLTYDPEYLIIDEVKEGTSPGFTYIDNIEKNNTNGILIFSATNSQSSTPISYANIANIVFRSVSQNEHTTTASIEVLDLKNTDDETIETYVEGSLFKLVTGICGDVNEDNVINIADATLITKYLVGDADKSDLALALADTNDNGETDVGDAMFIIQYFLGNRECICIDSPYGDVCRE